MSGAFSNQRVNTVYGNVQNTNNDYSRTDRGVTQNYHQAPVHNYSTNAPGGNVVNGGFNGAQYNLPSSYDPRHIPAPFFHEGNRFVTQEPEPFQGLEQGRGEAQRISGYDSRPRNGSTETDVIGLYNPRRDNAQAHHDHIPGFPPTRPGPHPFQQDDRAYTLPVPAWHGHGRPLEPTAPQPWSSEPGPSGYNHESASPTGTGNSQYTTRAGAGAPVPMPSFDEVYSPRPSSQHRHPKRNTNPFVPLIEGQKRNPQKSATGYFH